MKVFSIQQRSTLYAVFKVDVTVPQIAVKTSERSKLFQTSDSLSVIVMMNAAPSNNRLRLGHTGSRVRNFTGFSSSVKS